MKRTLAVVATGVLIAGSIAACGESDSGSGTPSTPASSATDRGGQTSWLDLGEGARVLVPREWQRVSYHGVVATVVFPIVFLTSGKIDGACIEGPSRSACTGRAWFAPDWTTPRDGVLLDWLDISIPAPISAKPFLPYIHAPTIRLSGHPAKITYGVVTSCPTGTASEIDAYVQKSRVSYPEQRYDMRACFGADAPPAARSAVMRMLHSLRFGSDR